MKKYKVLEFTFIIALILVAGCAKTFKEGSQTAASIQNVEQEARIGKEKINSAVSAMDQMFNDQQGDLKKQYEAFSESIKDMESQANIVSKRVDTMESKKAEYLQQWEQQMAAIESESVRQTAEQRRQSVEEMFNNVRMELDAAGKVYQPFVSKLNDISTAMNMDLNRNGLNAMRPIADKARADANIINSRLDAAISALSQAVKALTTSNG